MGLHVPQYPAPAEGHMKSFLRRAPLGIVLKAVASVGRAAAKGNFRNAQPTLPLWRGTPATCR